jgi:hypothetical protein
VYVKGEKNEYDLAMKQLKADLKVAKANAKSDIAGLKNETKIKVAEAKEALAKYKVKIASAKEKKRIETKKCMDVVPKLRPECKQRAIHELEQILDEIEAKTSQLPNVANLRKQYADQINGAKAFVEDSEMSQELKRLKEMMDGFKLQLKQVRTSIKENADILREKRAAFAKLKKEYTKKMASVKGKSNEKQAKKAIRESLGQDVKNEKKVLDALKADMYNMRQGMLMIRLKMKRAVLNDYSQFTMLKKKCKKMQKNNDRNSDSDSDYYESPDGTYDAPKHTGLETIGLLKTYYMETLETKIKSGKAITKSFILLNFHPDKLPTNIKAHISTDLANNDKQSNIYSSRVFSSLKTIALNALKTITLAELKTLLSTTTGGKIKNIT